MIKSKKISVIVLSLFAAISVFFGVYVLMPKTQRAASAETTVNAAKEYFYDFEDGDTHTDAGTGGTNFTVQTLADGNKVLGGGQWSKALFDEFTLDGLGDAWEISYDIHISDVTAATQTYDAFRMGMYAGYSTDVNTGKTTVNYDGAGGIFYVLPDSFTMRNVYSASSGDYLRSETSGEAREYRITFRYNGLNVYINVAPWGSTNIDEEGTWLNVNDSQTPFNQKTGYLCFQFGFKGDYIDNLSVKAIEAEGEALWIANAGSIWGTFTADAWDTDSEGNAIKNGNVYMSNAKGEDYMIMYYKTPLTDNFKIELDYYSSNSGADDVRIGLFTALTSTTGYSGWTNITSEKNITGTSGEWKHIAYRYYDGVLYSNINGTISSTTITKAEAYENNGTYYSANEYMVIRLKKCAKIDNLVMDLDADVTENADDLRTPPVEGETGLWLSAGGRSWNSTTGATQYDVQSLARGYDFDTDRFYYYTNINANSYNRGFIADKNLADVADNDISNYYKIDETKNLQLKFDLGLPVDELTEGAESLGTDARFGLFMRNIDNPDSCKTGVYIQVTTIYPQAGGGYKSTVYVRFGDGDSAWTQQAYSVYSADKYLSFDIVYIADAASGTGYVDVIAGGKNIVSHAEVDFNTNQGENDANGVEIDRRYIGYQLKNKNLSISNISLTDGDNVVIKEDALSSASKFTAVASASNVVKEVIFDNQKLMQVSGPSYPIALSNEALPTNYVVSFDVYTPVMQASEDKTAINTLNYDQVRMIFMTSYEDGVGMDTKGFDLTFGAVGYRYQRNSGGFSKGTLTTLKGDGSVYHIKVEYVNGIISVYVNDVLAIAQGYTVNRDADYVAFQIDNAGVYIGNYKVEQPAGTEITVQATNEELGTILYNGGAISAGTVFVVEGEEATFTFKAKNEKTAFVNTVFVDDVEQVVSGKEFTYTLSDVQAASANSTTISVKFSERAVLDKGTTIVYDDVETTATNSWKDSIYDYNNMYLVYFADTGSSNATETTEAVTVPGYGLGPKAVNGVGYLTYKISLNDASILGLLMDTRAKLSVWNSDYADKCFVDFYIGYEDPMEYGYDNFVKAESLAMRGATAAESAYHAKDSTRIDVDGSKEYVYVQVKVGTRDTNWIMIRELSFSGVSQEITDTFNIDYNNYGEGSMEWANGAYDYSGLEMVSHDDTYSLGVASTSTYGYITYRLNVADKLAMGGVEGLMVSSRGKLTNWGSKEDGRVDSYYIDYYVGYNNDYDTYTKLYEAPIMAGSTAAADKSYVFKLNPTEDIVYLQIRIRSASKNWIALRETTIDFITSINADNGFNLAYDSSSVSTVFQAVNGAYDYGNLRMTTFDGNHAVGAATTSAYGYITYKVVAPDNKKFEAIDISFRTKASNFSETGRTDDYYIDYYIGFECPIDNGYDNFTLVKAGEIGTGNGNYNDIHVVNVAGEIEGKTEFYIQVRIKDKSKGWLAIREITIENATYQTVQITYNYGVSYTEYNYSQFLGATLDTSAINIRDTFVRVDDKIYTDAAFTTEFDLATELNEDTVLYIKVANGLITYELNGGENAATNKGYYESITAVSIADAIKEGAVFGGWYVDSALDTLFTGIEQGRTGDITLYAKWVENATQYIVYYNANGGTIEGKEYDSDKGLYYEPYFAEIGLSELATATYGDKVFEGWFTEEGVKYTSIAVGTKGDITLIAKWAKESAITGATLTIGNDLTLNYYAYASGTSVTIKFTISTASGDKEVVVSGNPTGATVNGKTEYVFAFKGIAPQMMGDNVKAELIVDDAVVDTKAEYSVFIYCNNQLANDLSNELSTLIADLLEYGAMAQQYKGYKTESLVNAGIEGKSEFTAIGKYDFTNVAGTEVEGVAFSGIGVWFDYNNRLYVKFTGEAKVTISAEGLEETEITVTQASGDATIAYSNGISALDFDKVYTFKLYSGDTLVQTVTYSVKTFVYGQQTEDNATANLAKALYNYGLSSVAYKNTIA